MPLTTVRLYHLAHAWNLPSTTILETLHEAGHRLKSHFAEIDEEDIPGLRGLLHDAGLFETEEEPVEEAAASTEEQPAQEAEAPADAEAAPGETPEAQPDGAAPAPATAPAAPPKPAAPVPVGAGATPQRPVAKRPARPGDAPVGVASGFRGFAPGFDPNARRTRGTRPASPAGAPGAPGMLGRGGVPGAPGAPGATDGRRTRPGSRQAVSPTKRGRQTTRRAGGQAGQGRGRRLERRMQERERWMKGPSKKRRSRSRSSINVVRPEKIDIQLPISLKDLSADLAIRVSEIMGFLMKQGLMVNQNQPVPPEAIEHIGLNWNIDITILDEVLAENAIRDMDEEEDDDADLVERPPVVAVLGHVDHGKTSLLDYIRKTKKPVTAKEAGGITQHIGAYVAEHNGKKITFIDTPGHAAFTEMRLRGATVTDIVLLVVAVDDGVMPQTKEAIQHAQAAGAHVIVAANKIDKKGTDLEKVLTGLSQIEGMLPQSYGGETEVVGCSAVTGQGTDELLETILTYSELLELKANPTKAARGTVLEARKTVGRGIVVTLLVEDGTLHKGESILTGQTGGKVRRMSDENGKALKTAGPGTPVEILGINEVPEAGDRFYALESEAELKEILSERQDLARQDDGEDAFAHIPTDQEGIWKQLAAQEVKEVRVVLKTDVQGSLQVLKRELANLSTDEVRCKVIRDGCGGITTADVLLAGASDAVVIGFGVSADAKARSQAKERGIDIRTYRVIYKLLDGVKEIMGGVLEPEEREEVIGQVEVRKVIRISRIGNIAGCFVTSGIVRRNAMLRLVRDGIVLWQGGIDSLRRFKDDVKEVRENFECGLKLKGYDDIRDGDVLEVVEIQKIARTLD